MLEKVTGKFPDKAKETELDWLNEWFISLNVVGNYKLEFKVGKRMKRSLKM